uniref:Uncharacterized protein n=1 Tax=Takifugu rubripes TaxID=31033 RepID=A0A3B5KHS5_TAKRU
MSWLFLDWFVPLYLLVSVLVLAGFGACLYFLEPGLQDSHKWRPGVARTRGGGDQGWRGPGVAGGPTVPSCLGGTGG